MTPSNSTNSVEPTLEIDQLTFWQGSILHMLVMVLLFETTHITKLLNEVALKIPALVGVNTARDSKLVKPLID